VGVSDLKVRNLRVEVGHFSVEIDTMESSAGKCVVWTGPSGSGKSTLLSAVAGFLPLVRGTIELGSTRLDILPPEQRRVAMVFQRSALFPHLSVCENVEFGLRVQGLRGPDRRVRALDWLERFEVKDLSERRPEEISEGQAQRVAIARALAPEFPIVLMDEPFSALDTELRLRLRETLKAIIREKKLFVWMVTHHQDDAAAMGDRIIRLKEGRVQPE